jgi:hypothetical protein
MDDASGVFVDDNEPRLTECIRFCCYEIVHVYA